ncbi:hypothetical protein I41_36680 [Lacipirellula limnantheis]|uniref:Uncharacterized protein n=1 Tax=Lacipirellula limnantheis TaxID=2528024 RepID=A0A517U1G8_9BACT|nr:hypothetical protein I41_36680 [Lacipirellula limnantheis]
MKRPVAHFRIGEVDLNSDLAEVLGGVYGEFTKGSGSVLDPLPRVRIENPREKRPSLDRPRTPAGPARTLKIRMPDEATMAGPHPKKSRREIDSISPFLVQAAACTVQTEPSERTRAWFNAVEQQWTIVSLLAVSVLIDHSFQLHHRRAIDPASR